MKGVRPDSGDTFILVTSGPEVSRQVNGTGDCRRVTSVPQDFVEVTDTSVVTVVPGV